MVNRGFISLALMAAIAAVSLANFMYQPTKRLSITASNTERYTFACTSDNYRVDQPYSTLVAEGCDVVSAQPVDVRLAPSAVEVFDSPQVSNDKAVADVAVDAIEASLSLPSSSAVRVADNQSEPKKVCKKASLKDLGLAPIEVSNETLASRSELIDLSFLQTPHIELDQQPDAFRLFADDGYQLVAFTQKQGQSIDSALQRPELAELEIDFLKKAPVRKDAVTDRQFYLLVDENDSVQAVKVVRDNRDAEFVIAKKKNGYQFFNENGASQDASFMRYPLRFSRINSGFNPHRRHPVTKRVRPHKGVDFKAPKGTPIWAPYQGVVSFAGRQRGYGLIVEIDHRNGYKTKYAHLSKIPKGIRKGKWVKQKQVIGYVGNSGISTGAHLHYEVLVNGKAKNPLKVALPVDKTLSNELKKRINTYLPKLNDMIKSS